jgi:pimeloyl-ACP methyl ester carboxylesterase
MRCDLPNISVYYEEYGGGHPLLVLPGWGLDSKTSAYVMEPYFAVRSGWRRLYPDLPGMGQTAGPDWLTSHDQVLEVLLAFIDAVLPGRRFAVAGWSYGGLLAACRRDQAESGRLAGPPRRRRTTIDILGLTGGV